MSRRQLTSTWDFLSFSETINRTQNVPDKHHQSYIYSVQDLLSQSHHKQCESSFKNKDPLTSQCVYFVINSSYRNKKKSNKISGLKD
jgi:hypothetical protein